MCNSGPGNQHPSTSLLSAIVKQINTQGSTKCLKGQLKLPDSNFLICKSKSSLYSGGDIVPVFLFSKTGTLLPIRYIFMRPIPKNRQIYIYFFFTYIQPGPSFINFICTVFTERSAAPQTTLW